MVNNPLQPCDTWMLNQIQNNMLKTSFKVTQWTFREAEKAKDRSNMTLKASPIEQSQRKEREEL